MLRRVLCVLAVCCFCPAIAFADDKQLLEGTWQVIDGEANGQKMSTDQVMELQIVIAANELSVKPDGEGRKTTFKLDASNTPKTIDLIPLDGPRKGSIVPGIYSLKDGQFALCINIWGQDPTQRPTEFNTKEGDGVVLLILARTK